MDHKLTLTYRDTDGAVGRVTFDLPAFLSGILTVEVDGKQLELCRMDKGYYHVPLEIRTHDDHDAVETAVAAQLVDLMTRLPWTSGSLTRAEFQEWLATRKAAGAEIDVETAELGKWYAYDADPYGANPDLSDEMKQIGNSLWVRSPDSVGWIVEEDLPIEKFCAMQDRRERNGKQWAKEHPKAAAARKLLF